MNSNPNSRYLKEYFDLIWKFSTSVFGRPKNGTPVYAGSATFVVANSQKCFLTAEHVWKKINVLDRVSLSLGKKGQQVTIDKQHISCLYTCKGIEDDKGPDIALLKIPVSEMGNIEAYKVFYNLDLRKDKALDTSPIYNAVWGLIGAPGEFCLVENNHAKLNEFFLVCKLRSIHEHGGFDYADISLNTKDGTGGLPKSYGGLSGSGLWQIIDNSPSLEGIAFYERKGEEEHYIRCHARKSIYLKVLEGAVQHLV